MNTEPGASGMFKVWRLTHFGIDGLEVQEKSRAELKPNEVKVRIKATSLNYRDLTIIKGLWPWEFPLPVIPLSDGAGEVVEVGDQVTRAKRGDRVAAKVVRGWISGPYRPEYKSPPRIDGVLEEEIVLHESDVVQIPSHLSYEEAATNAIVCTGKLRPGSTVLTLGTGGVSIFALQFAKLLGARVIITSSSDEKLERVKRLGVTDTINYRSNPEWDKKVLELTGGVGVDQVVEVGGAGTLERSFKSLKPGGLISAIGEVAGWHGSIEFALIGNVQTVVGGSRLVFEEMNTAIEYHKLKPVIDRVFTFDKAKEAVSYMESGAHVGKIVIRLY